MSTNPKIFIKRLIQKLDDKDLIIKQQNEVIDLAVKQIIEISGVCPLNCDTRCSGLVVEKQLPDCWKKYLECEVNK